MQRSLDYASCRFCGRAITHGGTPALEAADQWFDEDDGFMCPDGEQEHRPMPDPTDFMDDDEIAQHNEAMASDPQYRDAIHYERN